MLYISIHSFRISVDIVCLFVLSYKLWILCDSLSAHRASLLIIEAFSSPLEISALVGTSAPGLCHLLLCFDFILFCLQTLLGCILKLLALPFLL